MDFKASEYLIPLFDFDILHMELNTPLFILGLVLLVMFFLNRWLFQPVLLTLDRRIANLASLNDSEVKDREELARFSQEYEKKLDLVRKDVARQRADSRKETQRQIEQILYQARQKADADLRVALGVLAEEVEQARGTLKQMARNLAEQTAQRILN